MYVHPFFLIFIAVSYVLTIVYFIRRRHCRFYRPEDVLTGQLALGGATLITAYQHETEVDSFMVRVQAPWVRESHKDYTGRSVIEAMELAINDMNACKQSAVRGL